MIDINIHTEDGKMCFKMSYTRTQTLRSQCELTSSFWVLPVTDCCPDPLPYFTSWLLWKRWMYKLGHYVLKARVSSNLINHGISCLFPTYAAWFCGSDSSASRRFHMSPATPSIQTVSGPKQVSTCIHLLSLCSNWTGQEKEWEASQDLGFSHSWDFFS